MKINNDLKNYIENYILPQYSKNDSAHNLEHIKYVINRSFKFANTLPNINYNMVYTIAAYHDIGHHISAKNHEIISAKIMSEDKNLQKFFSKEELQIIEEAIEDHRASSAHEPRSIYGKIVSTADRNNNIEACLKRTYIFGKKMEPNFTEEALFERSYKHLNMKFGENGYAKFFFEDEEYEKFLKEIRKLLSDKKLFIETQRNYINQLKNKGLISS